MGLAWKKKNAIYLAKILSKANQNSSVIGSGFGTVDRKKQMV